MSEEPLRMIDGKVLRIRQARQDDLDRLLWGKGHLRASRQRFLDRQEAGEIVILLPTLNDEPIGHFGVDLVQLLDEGGIYLYWFDVLEEYRGMGIGTAVIHQAEQLAVELGRIFSEIAVGKDNERARRLYERLGYRLMGDRMDAWIADLPDGSQVKVVDDNWVLRKYL